MKTCFQYCENISNNRLSKSPMSAILMGNYLKFGSVYKIGCCFFKKLFLTVCFKQSCMIDSIP
jgi:hypothetical protein